ncbi:hypothetical protein GJ496_005714 [Pomphorhynchus laevis]|nr:hypothetical protein GJ496_005714 [Pomphorhynchus laevis]
MLLPLMSMNNDKIPSSREQCSCYSRCSRLLRDHHKLIYIPSITYHISTTSRLYTDRLRKTIAAKSSRLVIIALYIAQGLNSVQPRIRYPWFTPPLSVCLSDIIRTANKTVRVLKV